MFRRGRTREVFVSPATVLWSAVNPGRFLALVAAVILAGAALVASGPAYLVVHGLAEVFSAVVAMAVFLLAWNARRLLVDEPFLVNVGVALLFVGLVDVLHALAYPGMGAFSAWVPGGDTVNLATQLWVVGRGLFALALLLALTLRSRAVRPAAVLVVGTVVTSTLLVLIVTGRFPACFVPGEGLTAFKIGTEGVISVLVTVSGAVLWWRRTRFDPRLVRWVSWAIGLTIASELCFTLYRSPYGTTNALGHLLKIAAYVMLYRALVLLGLREPYATLFRDLKRSETELAEANRTLEQRVAERTAALEERSERVRTIARELAQVERKERRRLAALLHDELAQLLVAAKVGLHLLQADGTTDAVGEKRSLAGMLDEALRLTRDLVAELAPPRLGGGALADAVHSLADRMQGLFGLRVVIIGRHAGASAEVEETVFGAIRELLVNVARHAEVSEATVQLATAAGGALRVVVEDRGVGIDPDALPVSPGEDGGFGLFNLREQIDLIGGSLMVESVPGEGTRVEIVVPADTSFPSRGAPSVLVTA